MRLVSYRNGADGWQAGELLDGDLVGPRDEIVLPPDDQTTADMVFSVAEILAHLSRVMTLVPGDIIATGTPAGVGMGRTPPVYLTVSPATPSRWSWVPSESWATGSSAPRDRRPQERAHANRPF